MGVEHPAYGTDTAFAGLARLATSAQADRAVVDGAKMPAMTAVDLWTSPVLRAAVAEEFAGAR